MKINQLLLFSALIVMSLFIASCEEENNNEPSLEVPANYSFARNGQSTVSFSGQTTRILMAEELISAMKDFNSSSELILERFRNETASGADANPFSSAELNAETKSVRNKTAASRDYFFTNTTASFAIREDFEGWMLAQVDEVFPAQNQLAAPGVPGQIADGSSTRYVNRQGLEYDQLVNKSLIGALMADQMLNNYLSPAVLDEASNRADNDAEILDGNNNYTTMEHKWDEAYGYLFGTAADLANPVPTAGSDDSFLNKYLGRVEGDSDFVGITERIFDAFKTGRAAIVAGAYDIRDEQAAIIREQVSNIIAIRAVYYLQQSKNSIDQPTPDYGSAFHGISEGYGFIYSLQFTREPGTNSPYFSAQEVDAFLTDLLDDGANGLWDVTPATLDALSDAIAARFSFTVEQAAATN